MAGELSPRQREIVQAPSDAQLLVLGGAGTGKTHVVVERLRHLVEAEGVAAGSEILVLTFTRAVVRELRKRVKLGVAEVRFVRPLTFDSFATRLLGQVRPADAGWRDRGYDGRIAAAAEAIERDDEGLDVLRSYRHVFVDEIQDLVGVRAELVLALLDKVPGFTVLGDPAQAIYDHQVADNAAATTSGEFLAELASRHEHMRTMVLDQDFRSDHRLGDEIRVIGSILREPDGDASQAHEELLSVLADLDHVSSFDDLAVALRGTHERTGVLCRTNAEVLRVSQLLYEKGVDHRLQHDATERVLPSWLALLFRCEERKRWSESRLAALVDRRVEAGLEFPPRDEVVRFLTDAVRDDTFDVDLFREAVRRGSLPDHLHDVEDVPIVISTVHRAKGLEFDRVFFGAPRHEVTPDEHEELRVLYVALSRSRHDVWTFNAPNMGRWHGDARCDDRWVCSPWKERWKTLGWEVRPSDVDGLRPPGTGVVNGDPLAIQERIEKLERGTDVVLRLAHVRATEVPIPFYAVTVDGEAVAETSEYFGETLSRRLRPKANTAFPSRMENVFVAGIESVVGSTSDGEAAGLGTSGIWLRPRISGLARIDWYAE